MRDEILAALLLSHSADLPTIRRFVAWVKLRRMVHNHFYMNAHWVRPFRRYHWVR